MRNSWTKELNFEKKQIGIMGYNVRESDFTLIYQVRQQGDTYLRAHRYDASANLKDSVTLINMGITGIIATIYILLIQGNLNGPTIGGILTISGFSAFGKHPKNILPIFLGVLIGSLLKVFYINDPAIQLAALFGTGLSPIAGKFGWQWGVVAGFIHSSVVLNVGYLHGGFNLYNNGFAAGMVAAVLLPIIALIKKDENNS
jgi:hypothetical protein